MVSCTIFPGPLSLNAPIDVGVAELVPIEWCSGDDECPSKSSRLRRRDGVPFHSTLVRNLFNLLGVRACRPIPKGMFICRYLGEVITEAEAERRGEVYDRQVCCCRMCSPMTVGNYVSFRFGLFPYRSRWIRRRRFTGKCILR